MRITLKPGVLVTVQAADRIGRDELARRLSVASSIVDRVEHGTVEPSPRFIAALMLYTGGEFEDLFDLVVDDPVDRPINGAHPTG